MIQPESPKKVWGLAAWASLCGEKFLSSHAHPLLRCSPELAIFHGRKWNFFGKPAAHDWQRATRAIAKRAVFGGRTEGYLRLINECIAYKSLASAVECIYKPKQCIHSKRLQTNSSQFPDSDQTQRKKAKKLLT